MLPIAILAGGFATRLGLLTEKQPKALIEICGRPFIEWQLQLLSDHGFTKVVFCLSHKSEMIENYLQSRSKLGLEISYSYDGSSQLGTGGAIRKAVQLLGETFMVLYGDSYLPIDYAAVEREFINKGLPSLMTVYQNEDLLDRSNVYFKGNEIIEYSKVNPKATMSHIDFGLMVFHRSIFGGVSEEGPFDLADLLHELSVKKLLAGYEVFQRFYEVGSLQGVADFEGFMCGSQG